MHTFICSLIKKSQSAFKFFKKFLFLIFADLAFKFCENLSGIDNSYREEIFMDQWKILVSLLLKIVKHFRQTEIKIFKKS